MSNQETSRLEFFVNLFNNLLHTRNLIIFIGYNGVTLSSFKKHQLQRSIFVHYDEADYLKRCRQFIIRHKYYYITFLLDHKDCELKHETLPVLGGMIKATPVEKFIKDNYQPTDIVAHNVYEIHKKNGEAWHTVIASAPFAKPTSKLLEYVINKSFKYSGIYFLSLEFQTIIDNILRKTNNTEYATHLQIFVTITQSSEIKAVVKYKKNIIDEQILEYPRDKSDEYIQGTIEQIVSDRLLFYKNYIEKLGLQTCVILLIDNNLTTLLSKAEFGENVKIIIVSGKEITSLERPQDNRFNDNILLEIFNNFNTHLALNKPLKALTKLTLLNNIIFKPLIALIIGIICTLLALEYQNWSTDYATQKLNQKYYAISKEYRQIQKNRPELEHIEDLVDLYNLEIILDKTSVNPVENLHHILTINRPELKIKQIKWYLSNPNNTNLMEQNLNISINIEYKNDHKSAIKGTQLLNNYANYLKSVFQGYKITYKRNPNDIEYLAKNILIPAHISIKGTANMRGDDAR